MAPPDKTKTKNNSALRAEAEAVVRAEHGDPFGFLGMHRAEGGTVEVRTFQPRALRVWVVDTATGKATTELARLLPEGFFCGPAGKPDRFRYRLRLDLGDGITTDIEDPYRFPPVLGELDMHLFVEGTHLRTYEKLGAHCVEVDGVAGVNFAVWAPNARRVSVVGDFNDWDGRRHPMRLRVEAGIWELFLPGVAPGALYKYELIGCHGQLLPLKCDPYGFYAEVPPKQASVVYDLKSYDWTDAAWIERRRHGEDRERPVSIYEVHLGSWRLNADEGDRPLTYRELADELGDYVADLGFTHIELMPVHEHPFSGSGGYQPIGLFAPTSRYGTPDDFRYFVDAMHRKGIAVIIDWVAGHFPSDTHGLAQFDGTHLYEHADPRQGMHREWNTLIYNYGRNEVTNFLYANALFWLDEYHIDGLRVDAVASMLYLDYAREPGEWIPNRYGGNENLEAIQFVRRMNEVTYADQPGIVTIAEESTAWPMVSRPTYVGGLGFGFKWNMGWMHDTLSYMSKDPIHRRYHHDNLTFGLLYAFSENFVLPLSHDEVVYGKRSVLGRMPGDRWRRFANLRAYYAFMWTHPGKKLVFMGCEFGQENEWNHNTGLDWGLLDDAMHMGVQRLMRDLNRVYTDYPALHQLDCDHHGFQWIDCCDRDNSVIAFLRRGREAGEFVVVVCNFTPEVRKGYHIGVPEAGCYREILNTDGEIYGGSGVGNDSVTAIDYQGHGFAHSLDLTLPPLAVIVLRWEGM